jgi:hypothetical protein
VLQEHQQEEHQQEEHQQQVLGLLGQVASSSAAAGWQVLQWLQPLITAALSTGQKVSDLDITCFCWTLLLILSGPACPMTGMLHNSAQAR